MQILSSSSDHLRLCSQRQNRVTLAAALGMHPIISSVALILLLSPPTCASSTAHQSKEGSVYSKLPPIVFAPSGRLHGVEKAARSSLLLDSTDDDAACTVFSMKCSGRETGAGGFAIMVGIGPSSPYLCREPMGGGEAVGSRTNSNGAYYRSLAIECADLASPMAAISSSLLVGVGGRPVDSTVLLRRTTDEAMSLYHAENKGIDWFVSHSLEGLIQDEAGSHRVGAGVAGVDVTNLARRVADAAQVSTQRMGSKFGRMLAVSNQALRIFLRAVSRERITELAARSGYCRNTIERRFERQASAVAC